MEIMQLFVINYWEIRPTDAPYLAESVTQIIRCHIKKMFAEVRLFH